MPALRFPEKSMRLGITELGQSHTKNEEVHVSYITDLAAATAAAAVDLDQTRMQSAAVKNILLGASFGFVFLRGAANYLNVGVL